MKCNLKLAPFAAVFLSVTLSFAQIDIKKGDSLDKLNGILGSPMASFQSNGRTTMIYGCGKAVVENGVVVEFRPEAGANSILNPTTPSTRYENQPQNPAPTVRVEKKNSPNVIPYGTSASLGLVMQEIGYRQQAIDSIRLQLNDISAGVPTGTAALENLLESLKNYRGSYQSDCERARQYIHSVLLERQVTTGEAPPPHITVEYKKKIVPGSL